MQSWQNGSNEARKKFTFAYQIHSFFFFKWGFTFDLSLSPSIFTVFVFFSGFVLFNGRWMKVGRVFCPSFIHHLLGFLLSYTLHTLPAASHCLFLDALFFSVISFVPDANPKYSKAGWIYYCLLSNSDL